MILGAGEGDEMIFLIYFGIGFVLSLYCVFTILKHDKQIVLSDVLRVLMVFAIWPACISMLCICWYLDNEDCVIYRRKP